MRKIREVLRLRLEADLSVRQISICTKVSVAPSRNSSKSAQALGLTWPTLTYRAWMMADWLPCSIRRPIPAISARHVVPDWPSVHQELKRRGSPKQLLWEEYTQRYPNSCYAATPSSGDRWQVLQAPVAKALHAPESTRQGKALYRLLRAHGAHRVADYG